MRSHPFLGSRGLARVQTPDERSPSCCEVAGVDGAVLRISGPQIPCLTPAGLSKRRALNRMSECPMPGYWRFPQSGVASRQGHRIHSAACLAQGKVRCEEAQVVAGDCRTIARVPNPRMSFEVHSRGHYYSCRARLSPGRGVLPGHKDRIGEAESRRKPQNGENQEKDLANREGVNADEEHGNYGYYKHCTCHAIPRP